MKMLNSGFSSYIPMNKIKAVVPYESNRIKKEIQQLRDEDRPGRLLDLTKKKAVKTVIIMDDDTYVLSNVSVETIIKRVREEEDNE